MSAEDEFVEEPWDPGPDGQWVREHRGNAEGITLDDFYAYLPKHEYFYVPTRELWPATSVSSVLPPVPVLDENGRPRLKANGQPLTIPASR